MKYWPCCCHFNTLLYFVEGVLNERGRCETAPKNGHAKVFGHHTKTNYDTVLTLKKYSSANNKIFFPQKHRFFLKYSDNNYISNHGEIFLSIWPIAESLIGTTTLGQSGPGSNRNKRVLQIYRSTELEPYQQKLFHVIWRKLGLTSLKGILSANSKAWRLGYQ